MKLSLSFPLLGLTACVLPAILLGCGGGGGGPSTRASSTPEPQPLPTTVSTAAPTNQPTPQPTSADSCDPDNYNPNYAGSVSRLLHWRGFPLRVFLESTDSRTRALTIRGFNQWNNATDNRVRYNVVNTRAGADITVKFAKFADGDGDTLGVTTTYFFEGATTIERAEIQFYYFPFDSRPDAEATNQSVAAHEFGHALGIGGHSPDENDLMFAFANGGDEEVTERDKNTLLTSYCNNFPNRNDAIRAKPQGALKSFTIKDKASELHRH